MVEWLRHLPPLAVYAVLYLALLLEGTGLPGILIEPFFLASGLMIGTGEISLALAILSAALGNWTGNLLGYSLGAWGGPRVLDRYGQRVGLTDERREAMTAWFQRYGGLTVLIGRWFGPIRTPGIFLAGTMGVPFAVYAAYSAIAALSWTAAYQIAFWQLGRATMRLWARSSHWLAWAFVFVVLVGILYLGWRAHHGVSAKKPPSKGEE